MARNNVVKLIGIPSFESDLTSLTAFSIKKTAHIPINGIRRGNIDG
jgi:hypothetical protein